MHERITSFFLLVRLKNRDDTSRHSCLVLSMNGTRAILEMYTKHMAMTFIEKAMVYCEKFRKWCFYSSKRFEIHRIFEKARKWVFESLENGVFIVWK